MSSSVSPFKDPESNENKPKPSSKQLTTERNFRIALIVLSIVLCALLIAVIILAIKVAKHSSKHGKHVDGVGPSDICTTTGCLVAALELANSVNTSVDPCDNFYNFCCGKWIASNPGYVGGSKFGGITVTGWLELHDQVLSSIEDPKMSKTVKKVAIAYKQCGDNPTITDDDLNWLSSRLNDVGGWPMIDADWEDSDYHWEANLAKAIQKLAIRAPVFLTVEVNIYDTRNNVIYVRQPPTLPVLNKDQILGIVKKIGDREDNSSIEREYREVEKLTERLNKAMRGDNDLMNDPNEYQQVKIGDLDDIIPWINWREFFHTVYLPYMDSPPKISDHVFLFGKSYLNEILQSLFHGNITRRTIANYIASSFVQEILNLVPTAVSKLSLQADVKKPLGLLNIPPGFSEPCFNFFSSRLNAAFDHISYKNRKMELVDRSMLDYSLTAMKQLVEESTWLDRKTKAAVFEKVNTMEGFIGYPQRWKDPKKVDEYLQELPNMTDSVFRNKLIIDKYFLEKTAQLLSIKNNRKVWPYIEGAHATLTNAVHAMDLNLIIIMAGIQRPPMFDAARPKYWNFGAMGLVLSHEITHGFDTTGGERDKFGNLKDWWTAESRRKFRELSKCYIEQYDKFDIGYKGYHINGTNTVGENIADNGGVHQSFRAYQLWQKDHGKEKALPGFEKYDTNQLFFMSLVQPWCNVALTPEAMYQAAAPDNHSPNMYRILGSMPNSKDFADTFKCKPGTPMNPKKKCQIW